MHLGQRDGAPRMRHRPWTGPILGAALICIACSSPARADGLNYLETADLRIVDFAPAGDYLVPYATQCFLNALAVQKKIFGYTPDGGATVLLQDFSDRGNATTVLGAPRDRVFVDIAPVNLAFETFSPGERLFTVANHETMHLVTSDMASPADMRYRRLFAGKVAPVAEHPESILYYYLTNPACLVAALVPGGQRRLHGNLARRRSRSRPGRLRRNGVSRHGSRRREFLRPAGTGLEGHRGRLPGRSQRLPLRHPIHELPGADLRPREADRVVATRTGLRSLLRRRVRARLRHAAHAGLAGMDPLGARVPGSQPQVRSFLPDHATHEHRARGARGDIPDLPERRPIEAVRGACAIPGACRISSRSR